MKLDFSDLNIAPMPNPKPLKVERVLVRITNEDGKQSQLMEGAMIRNANLDPHAIIWGRY